MARTWAVLLSRVWSAWSPQCGGLVWSLPLKNVTSCWTCLPRSVWGLWCWRQMRSQRLKQYALQATIDRWLALDTHTGHARPASVGQPGPEEFRQPMRPPPNFSFQTRTGKQAKFAGMAFWPPGDLVEKFHHFSDKTNYFFFSITEKLNFITNEKRK